MSIARQELFKICSGCGEIFDASIEAEWRHHDRGEHTPLLPQRKQWGDRLAQALVCVPA
jgi:hypothetical protein